VTALVALIAALLAAEVYARSSVVPARPAAAAARAVGDAVRPHPGLRRLLVRRLDRRAASGLLLTLALMCAIVGGVVLGVLVYLVRGVPAVRHADNAVATWGFVHRSSLSTSGLEAITQFGSIRVVAGLALAIGVLDLYRTRNRWSVPFLVAVLGGMEILTLSVKALVGRARPTLEAAAASLGPSFPSGHSATAAAFYSAVALLVGRRLPWRRRQILIALAVALAVAVAASRVLLDLHWLSDVVGGLSLGWGWFALCAALFGGRLLRPTALADVAAGEAAAPGDAQRGGNGLPPRRAADGSLGAQ
jgi:undecaprenyl-diphosphatase